MTIYSAQVQHERAKAHGAPAAVHSAEIEDESPSASHNPPAWKVSESMGTEGALEDYLSRLQPATTATPRQRAALEALPRQRERNIGEPMVRKDTVTGDARELELQRGEQERRDGHARRTHSWEWPSQRPSHGHKTQNTHGNLTLSTRNIEIAGGGSWNSQASTGNSSPSQEKASPEKDGMVSWLFR